MTVSRQLTARAASELEESLERIIYEPVKQDYRIR